VTKRCYVLDDDEESLLEFRDEAPSEPSWKHVPEWDQYADIGYVPAAAFLAAGRAVLCDECDGDVTDGGEAPIIEGRAAWCSEWCRAKSAARIERMEEAKAEASGAVTSRRPWITVGRIFVGGNGKCDCWHANDENIVAWISFPGSKHDANTYCHGCGRISICAGDADAWRACEDRA